MINQIFGVWINYVGSGVIEAMLAIFTSLIIVFIFIDNVL